MIVSCACGGLQKRTRINTEAPSVAVAKECCCCCFCAVLDGKAERTPKCEMGADYFNMNVRFSIHLLDLSSEAEHSPLKKRASPATLDAHSTNSLAGIDTCNVPMSALLAPQRKARGKKTWPPNNSKPDKKGMCDVLHRHMISGSALVQHPTSAGVLYSPNCCYFCLVFLALFCFVLFRL